jgi:hypothetical protein
MSEFRKRKSALLIVFAIILLALPGCRTPTATLDLIAIGRKGLASARKAQQSHQADLLRHHKARLASLDSAFDNDVRLVEAGQLKLPDGEEIKLSADWIISARKGYAMARTIMAEQMRTSQAAGAVEIDNINAADEALEMATQLTVLQWNVGERIKQQFLKLSNNFQMFQNMQNFQTKPNERNNPK